MYGMLCILCNFSVCISGTQVGFDAGDGINYYNMPGSQTDIIKDEVQGKQFAYRIDRAEIQDPETPGKDTTMLLV